MVPGFGASGAVEFHVVYEFRVKGFEGRFLVVGVDILTQTATLLLDLPLKRHHLLF